MSEFELASRGEVELGIECLSLLPMRTEARVWLTHQPVLGVEFYTNYADEK